MLKKILFVSLILLMANAVFAFDIEVPTDTVTIPRGGTGEVSIKIINDINARNFFTIGIADVKPWIGIDTPQPVTEPFSEKTIKLTMSPSTAVTPATYKIRIDITSTTTGEKKLKDIIIVISKGEGADVKSSSITGDLVPKGNVNITLSVNNFGTTTMQDLVLNITVISEKGAITQLSQPIEKLDPSQTTEITKTIVLPAGAPSGNYQVISTLYLQGTQIDTNTDVFRVAPRAMIEESEEGFIIFIGYGKTFKARNDGNIDGNITFSEEINGIAQIFYSGAKPSSKAGMVYVWTIDSIRPGEEAEVTYYVNFLPLIIPIVIIIVLIWYYLTYMRAIKIKKMLLETKKIAEGEEFTVRLDIKNSSGREIENIVVKDIIPTIFKVKEVFGSPQKVKTGGMKTLVWKINQMKRGEERILTYKMVPALGVRGEMTLEKAIGEYTLGKRTKRVYSNVLIIGEKHVEPKEEE